MKISNREYHLTEEGQVNFSLSVFQGRLQLILLSFIGTISSMPYVLLERRKKNTFTSAVDLCDLLVC